MTTFYYVNQMPCRITDGPQYDDTQVDLPDGLQVYGQLPNFLADELILDEMAETHASGRSNAAQIFALESQTRGDDAELGRLVRNLVLDMKTTIGEGETATRWYINGMDD